MVTLVSGWVPNWREENVAAAAADLVAVHATSVLPPPQLVVDSLYVPFAVCAVEKSPTMADEKNERAK